MHSAISVIFVRRRMAEVDEYTIAEFTRDVTTELSYNITDRGVISPYDLAQIFRIQASA
jgi:hypothetical protein